MDQQTDAARDLRDAGAIRVPRERGLDEPEARGEAVRDIDAGALQ